MRALATTARFRRPLGANWSTTAVDLGLAAVVLVAVLSPMIFTHRGFEKEFTNHLWLARQQAHAIAHHGIPTYYVNSDGMGVFYPFYVFYGGSLYALVGYISLLTGVEAAFVLAVGIGMAAAYGGMYWLAAEARLPRLWRHLPALTYLTAPVVEARVYAEGHWPEFIAQCSVPLVLAGVVHVARRERWTPGGAAGLLAGVFLLSGSHNLTLIWGSIALAALLLAGVLAARGSGRGVRRRGVFTVAAIGLLGCGLNAWFLIPDLAYHGHTAFNAVAAFDSDYLGTAKLLFWPVRLSAPLSSIPAAQLPFNLNDNYVQIPSLALVWALACLPLLRAWPEARALRRVVVGLLVVGAAIVLLVLRGDPTLGGFSRSVWTHLPAQLRYVQRAFRLDAYLVVIVSSLVVVGLVALHHRTSGWRRRLAIAPLVAVSVLGLVTAVRQAWKTPSDLPDRRTVLTGSPFHQPEGWSDHGDYRDYAGAGVPSPGEPPLLLDPATAAAGRPLSYTLPDGGTHASYRTNIAAGTFLVSLSGATGLGRSREYLDANGIEQKGLQVVRLDSPGATGTITIATRRRLPIVAGTVVSLLSVALLAFALMMLALRRRLPGQAPRRRPSRRRAKVPPRAGLGASAKRR